jgi:hypothetical protein
MTTVRRRVAGNGPKPKPKPSRKKKGTTYKTGRVGTKSLIVPVNDVKGVGNLIRQIRSAQRADHNKRYGGARGYTAAAMNNARFAGLRGQNIRSAGGRVVEGYSSDLQVYTPAGRAVGIGYRNAKRVLKVFK